MIWAFPIFTETFHVKYVPKRLCFVRFGRRSHPSGLRVNCFFEMRYSTCKKEYATVQLVNQINKWVVLGLRLTGVVWISFGAQTLCCSLVFPCHFARWLYSGSFVSKTWPLVYTWMEHRIPMNQITTTPSKYTLFGEPQVKRNELSVWFGMRCHKQKMMAPPIPHSQFQDSFTVRGRLEVGEIPSGLFPMSIDSWQLAKIPTVIGTAMSVTWRHSMGLRGESCSSDERGRFQCHEIQLGLGIRVTTFSFFFFLKIARWLISMVMLSSQWNSSKTFFEKSARGPFQKAAC